MSSSYFNLLGYYANVSGSITSSNFAANIAAEGSSIYANNVLVDTCYFASITALGVRTYAYMCRVMHVGVWCVVCCVLCVVCVVCIVCVACACVHACMRARACIV